MDNCGYMIYLLGICQLFLGFIRVVSALRPLQHGCSSRILGGWAGKAGDFLAMTRLSYCRFVQAQLPKQTPGCLEEARGSCC